MANKRKHKRYIKRCKTEFSCDGKSFTGIGSDFSTTGLFIRSNNPFDVNSNIEIEVHLPDGSVSKLKGRVKRSINTPSEKVMGEPVKKTTARNGMGVEITDKDANYLHFMSSLVSEKMPLSPGVGKAATTQDLFVRIINTQKALINLLVNNGMVDKKELIAEIKRLGQK